MRTHATFVIGVLCSTWTALSVSPTLSAVYLTQEQALQLAFPAADKVTLHRDVLTAAQKGQVRRRAHCSVSSSLVRYWSSTKQGKPQGFAVIDDVMGKHRPITFMVVVDPDGRVRFVEVLAYRESYGGQIRNRSFRRQFVGKTAADPLRLHVDVQNIATATISCRALTDAVRRVLVTLDVLGVVGDD